MEKINILITAGIYPTKKSPQLGSFIRESVEAFRSFDSIDVFLAVGYSFPFNPVITFIKHFMVFIKIIFRIMKHKPALIIAHTLFPSGLIALIAAKIFNKKIIIFAHGGDVYGMSKNKVTLWKKESMNLFWRIRFQLIHYIIKNADGIIYVSNYLYETAIKYFDAIPSRSLVSPIGYNPDRFKLNIDFESRDKILLYVGRIDVKKGMMELFDILFNMKDYLKKNEYSVQFIGKVYYDEFYNQINEHKKYYNISYEGEKESNILHEYYNRAKLTIMPSLFESFGLVAVESLACGTPVACFPNGGLKEIVQDDINGIHLNSIDEVLSSDQIINLLNNTEKLNNLSENANDSIEQFNIINTHRENLQFINKVIE